jgi:photosystem II stability/assembly factor-like uncharacterized protein
MSKKRILLMNLILLGTFLFAYHPAPAKTAPEKMKTADFAPDTAIFKNLAWRSIGPAIMSGRVADVEGVPGNANIVYVGTASGGVWKTINGGNTWKPIFDSQPVASIGDIALEPGNPDVIYVGTGETNPRNSVSFGNGVYKSTDGGSTWTHLGLADTERISRILINPQNPNIVYVGALGHAFAPNKERGVFMSADGGKTWEKVLYTDDRHGVSDMEIDWQNPNILYAGLWHFERKPWTFESGDEQGGVYKSIDAGRTWKKLTEGLPKLMGRIAVKVPRTNSEIVYVLAETKESTLYRSENRGESFQAVYKGYEIVSRGFYYTDLRIDPKEENRLYAVASSLFTSIDGGKTFKGVSSSTHSDYHALWIDPENPNRLWQGNDGGIAVSYDRGRTWIFAGALPVGQFYQVCADNRLPFYYVGGGLQDNGTWLGPSRTKESFYGIMNDDWRMVSFGDGFYIAPHPDDPDIFLSESQGGEIVRTNMRTGEQQSVVPDMHKAYGAGADKWKYRFHWNAPIIPSPFDGKMIYFGGNVVFKSKDFGTTWEIISPDLTTNDKAKQKSAGGPVKPENTSAEVHCTIISLAESPVQRDQIWAGTDDGNVQLTLDGGKTWQNVVQNFPGLPAFSPVSHLEPSRTSGALAYCAFDRHMFDDFKPYIFVTKDSGKTWMNITGNLPETAHVWVVREDPKNPNLLYAGTELGLFASYTAGKSWIKFHFKNFPTVAVHDILVHPKENDLILGTHGRSIWIFDDISALQQLKPETLTQPACLFDVRPALRFSTRFTRYGQGESIFKGDNPPYGALMTYYLKEKPQKEATLKIEILDGSGRSIRSLSKLPSEPGLNRVAWDLSGELPRPRREKTEMSEEEEFFGGPRGAQVLPGTYTVRLILGENKYETSVEVKLDPTLSVSKEELGVQNEMARKIVDMISSLNDGLKALDGIKSQLEERKKTAETQAKDEFGEALKYLKTQTDELEALLVSISGPERYEDITGAPTVVQKLGQLFSTIDRANAAPNQAQVEYFRESGEEFKTALAKINDYLGKKALELNESLFKFKLPGILVPPPVKL